MWQRWGRTPLRADGDEGAVMAEYAFVVAGIALVVAGAAGLLGAAVDAIFGDPILLDWLTP